MFILQKNNRMPLGRKTIRNVLWLSNDMASLINVLKWVLEKPHLKQCPLCPGMPGCLRACRGWVEVKDLNRNAD